MISSTRACCGAVATRFVHDGGDGDRHFMDSLAGYRCLRAKDSCVIVL